MDLLVREMFGASAAASSIRRRAGLRPGESTSIKGHPLASENPSIRPGFVARHRCGRAARYSVNGRPGVSRRERAQPRL